MTLIRTFLTSSGTSRFSRSATLIALAVVIVLQITAAGIDVAEYAQADSTSLTNMIQLSDIVCGLVIGWLIRN